jgi:hypothetical protein
VPYVDKSDGELKADPADVAQVEEILEADALPVSDRMRAKAEIVDFLEGRLEASAFIEHAIDRQRLREVCAERETQTACLRLTVDHD